MKQTESKKVGFNLEGIVAANTIALWDDHVSILENTGKHKAASVIRKMTDSMVKALPLHDYLFTSPE